MKRRRADSMLNPQTTFSSTNYSTASGSGTSTLDQESVDGLAQEGNKRHYGGHQVSVKLPTLAPCSYVRNGLNLQKKGAHMRNPLISVLKEKSLPLNTTASSVSGTEEASCTDFSGTANSYSQGSYTEEARSHDTAPQKSMAPMKRHRKQSKKLKIHRKAKTRLSN